MGGARGTAVGGDFGFRVGVPEVLLAPLLILQGDQPLEFADEDVVVDDDDFRFEPPRPSFRREESEPTLVLRPATDGVVGEEGKEAPAIVISGTEAGVGGFGSVGSDGSLDPGRDGGE